MASTPNADGSASNSSAQESAELENQNVKNERIFVMSTAVCEPPTTTTTESPSSSFTTNDPTDNAGISNMSNETNANVDESATETTFPCSVNSPVCDIATTSTANEYSNNSTVTDSLINSINNTHNVVMSAVVATNAYRPLSEATIVRLYNSVIVTSGNSPFTPVLPSGSFYEQKSVNSFSSEDVGLCRICRYNRSDMDVLECPCECKGTVGFIHLQCLKRWMLLRRNSRCEICNAPFNIPSEELNFKRMFCSFFSMRCCGAIMRNLLYCGSLLPLAHIILQQVLICMERLNVNPTERVTAKEVLLGTFALLTSSAVFFHFFEFITTRLMHCKHILRRWWYFGNSNDFSLYELDVMPSEFQ